MMIDFSRVHIMSRDIVVDRNLLENFRILNVFNKIENIEFAMNEAAARDFVNSSLDSSTAEFKYKTENVRGSVILMESGIRNAGKGQVLVTTMFHFADIYSMQMFVMKMPHAVWNHDEAMVSMKN